MRTEDVFRLYEEGRIDTRTAAQVLASGSKTKEARVAALKKLAFYDLEKTAAGQLDLFRSTSGLRGISGDALRTALQGFTKSIGYLGGGAAVLGGVAALHKGMSKAKERRLAKRSWRQVMTKNPDLKSLDRKTLKKHFRTLVNFNPEMASDPTVAGSFLRMTAQRSDIGLDPKTIKDLVDIRKSHRQAAAAEPLSGVLGLIGRLGVGS